MTSNEIIRARNAIAEIVALQKYPITHGGITSYLVDAHSPFRHKAMKILTKPEVVDGFQQPPAIKQVTFMKVQCWERNPDRKHHYILEIKPRIHVEALTVERMGIEPEEVRRMAGEGLHKAEIARRIGCTQDQLKTFCTRYGIKVQSAWTMKRGLGANGLSMDEIADLFRRGFSKQQIAAQAGCLPDQIRNYIHNYGWTMAELYQLAERAKK